MSKLITILAWLLVIFTLIGFFIFIGLIYKEMLNIFDYQMVPYIRWKFNHVRKAFRKKDN